jgi:hypothetical protein
MATSTQQILALARKFPLLREKFDSCDYHPTQFDPDELMRISKPWSTTERGLAEFIVSVWDPYYGKHHPDCVFRLAFVAGNLADENREVLAEWIRKPFYL